jgi:hypothetical protein
LDKLITVAGSVPSGLLAATYLLVWISPLLFGANRPRDLLLLLLLEFLVIHSSGYLLAVHGKEKETRQRVKSFLLVFIIYCSFAAGLAIVFKNYFPPLMFVLLFAARATQLRNASDRASKEWSLTTLAYFVAVIGCVFLPVPELGVTQEIVPQLHLPGKGALVSNPQSTFAAGFFYSSFIVYYQLVSGGVIKGFRQSGKR